MRDLDALLARIDAALDQPPLPTTWLVSTTPTEIPIRHPADERFSPDDVLLTGRWEAAGALWPPVLPSGRFGCNVEPIAERPRPRPPRPFPVAESTALARRVRAGLDARAEQLARDLAPRPTWWRRLLRRG